LRCSDRKNGGVVRFQGGRVTDFGPLALDVIRQ